MASIERPAIRSGLLLVPAVLTAAILLASPPLLSDDVFRYLLDGACVADGFSPFSHAPNSPKIADIVAASPGRINHPHLRTIYPPATQGLFGALRALGLGVLSWRLLLLVVLAGGAAVAARQRPTVGAAPTGAWIASHPLALLTAAGNGNVDVLGILVMGLAVSAAASQRHRVVGFWLAMGAAVKLFPIGLAVATLGRFGARRSASVLLVAGVCLALAYAPFVSSGPKAFGSLAEYAESWEFNGSLHPALTATVDSALRVAGVTDSVNLGRAGSPTYYAGEPSFDRWVSRRQLAASASKGLGLLALVGVAWVSWRRRLGFASSVVAILSTLFLFSAVVHPWYLLWLLVPSVLSANRVGIAWCASATLAFWAPGAVLDGFEWHLPMAARALEYAIPGLLAVSIGASLTGRGARAYYRFTPATVKSPLL